jgi:hypothetical protein
VLVRYAGLAWLPRDITTLSDTLDWFTGKGIPAIGPTARPLGSHTASSVGA